MEKLSKLRGFYLFLGLAGGSFGSYLTLLLVHNGLDSGQIGILMATGTLIAITIQPIWGIVSDRYNQTRLVLILSVAIPALLAVFYRSEYFIVLLLVYTLSTIFSSTQAPIADSYAISAAKRAGATYGSIRLMMSIGAAVGAYLGGLYVSSFSVSTIWLPFLMFNLIAVLIALTLPKQAEENHMMRQSFSQGVKKLLGIGCSSVFGWQFSCEPDDDCFWNLLRYRVSVGWRFNSLCRNCAFSRICNERALHAVCFQGNQKAGSRADAAPWCTYLCLAVGHSGGIPLSIRNDWSAGTAWSVIRVLLYCCR